VTENLNLRRTKLFLRGINNNAMSTGKFLRKLSYGHTLLVLLRLGLNLGTNYFYFGQPMDATTVRKPHSVKFFRMCSIVGELITCAPAEPYEGGCK
jgi:hypothetical protein